MTEKLKQPAYEGREGDLNWQRRLIAAVQSKARAPNQSLPLLPHHRRRRRPPAPDPKAEREAAVKEAEAFLAHAEEEEPAARRNKTPAKFTPGGFTNEDIYGEYKEATKRIDEQI